MSITKPGYAVKCPCKRWEYRELPTLAAPGYAAMPVKCPRCKGHFLIVMRVIIGRHARVRVLGITQYKGYDEQSMREALSSFPSIDSDSIEFMVYVAQMIAPQTEARAS